VSCQDTRELFSAWVDGEATPAERARVEEHLRACADCRRELDHFRHTLALLRAVEPARAPAGFAGGVLARARPAPRPRLLERVFLPLGAKLPLHAAAIVMVGVLVASVVRETPELSAVEPAPSAAPPSIRSATPKTRCWWAVTSSSKRPDLACPEPPQELGRIRIHP